MKTLNSGPKVIIIGATSAIAEAFAKRMAASHSQLVLVARNREKLAAVAANLKISGAESVDTFMGDFGKPDNIVNLFTKITRRHPQFDIVLIAHGTLPNNAACERDWDSAEKNFQDNCLSAIQWMQLLGNHLAHQKHGTLAIISSVAGDRGRQSNFYYGAAKAAVSTFAQGLRNRLAPLGVRVLTIKPGFVATPMTAHIQPQGFLWAQPETLAAGIERAIAHKKNIVYLPGFWRWIMLIIKLIPESIFRRLKL